MTGPSARPPGSPRLPCGSLGCRARATHFGRFAGGVCRRHALEMIEMFPELGVEQFHPEHRDDLAAGAAGAASPGRG